MALRSHRARIDAGLDHPSTALASLFQQVREGGPHGQPLIWRLKTMKKATLFVTLVGSAMFVAAGCSEPASTTPATTPGGPTGPAGMKTPMPKSDLGAPSTPESGSAAKAGADAAPPADATAPAEKPAEAPAEAPK